MLILVVVGVIFYFLNEQKAHLVVEYLEKYEEDPEKYVSKWHLAVFIVYSMLLFIVLFNKFVMSYLFHHLTDM